MLVDLGFSIFLMALPQEAVQPLPAEAAARRALALARQGDAEALRREASSWTLTIGDPQSFAQQLFGGHVADPWSVVTCALQILLDESGQAMPDVELLGALVDATVGSSRPGLTAWHQRVAALPAAEWSDERARLARVDPGDGQLAERALAPLLLRRHFQQLLDDLEANRQQDVRVKLASMWPVVDRTGYAEGRLALLMTDAQALIVLHRGNEALDVLRRAQQLGESIAWPAHAAKYCEGLVHRARGDIDRARDLMLSTSEDLLDAGHERDGWGLRQHVTWMLAAAGRTREAIDILAAAETSVEDAGLRASVMMDLGKLTIEAGNRSLGLEIMERAATLVDAHPEVGYRERVLDVLRPLSCRYHLLGLDDKSEALMVRIDALARQAGDEQTLAMQLSCRAGIAVSRGQRERALGLYNELAAKARQRGWSNLVHHGLRGTVHLLMSERRWDEALATQRQLLAAIGETGDDGAKALAVQVTGEILVNAGRPHEAIPHLADAAARHERAGDVPRALFVRQLQANALADTGETTAALALFDSIGDQARAGGMEGRWRSISLAQALLLARRDDPIRASGLLYRVLASAREDDDIEDQHISLNNLANVEMDLGRGASALELARQAADFERQHRDVLKSHMAEDNLIANELNGGDAGRALVAAERALADPGARTDVEKALLMINRAAALHQMQRHDEAISSLTAPLTCLLDAGQVVLATELRREKGRYLVESNRTREGMELLEIALADARRLLLSECERRCLSTLAKAHADLGEHHRAAARYCETLRASLRRYSHEAASQAPSLTGDVRAASELAITACTKLDTTSDLRVELAFEAMEAGRAQLLLRQMATQGASLWRSLPEGPTAQVREAREVARRTQSAAFKAANTPNPDLAEIERLRGELDQAQARLEQTILATRQFSARTVDWTNAQAMSFAEARRALADDEAMIFYLGLGGGPLVALVLRKDGGALLELGVAHHLQDAIRSFGEVVGTPGSSELALAERLYDVLLRPLEPRLAGATRLLISPDGFLHKVPFEALWRRGDSAMAGQRLIERHEVRYTPSMRVHDLRTRHAPPPHTPRRLLAIGDPDYTDSRPTDGPAKGSSTTRLTSGDVRPLPGSGAEARALASLFDGDHATLLLQQAASTAKVEAALTSGRDWFALHFACHAHVDPGRNLMTGLVLANRELLNVFDLMRLQARSHVVVLSACGSALGHEVSGEGMTGLVQSFLSAGAGHVVAALWPVPDGDTAPFMLDFYRAMLAGQAPPAALRTAKLSCLRAGGNRAHPAHWANFVVW